MNAIASAVLALVQQSKAFDADTHAPLLALFPATRTLQTLASTAHKIAQGEALRAIKARKIDSLRKRAGSPKLQAQRADELSALAEISMAIDLTGTDPAYKVQLCRICRMFQHVRQFPSVQHVTAFDPQSTAGYPRNEPAYSTYTVAAIENGAIVAPITLRILKARDGMTNGAALFVNHGRVHAFGYSGKVGGYGYHRASEAAERAFQSAGVTLAHSFGGAGDKAIEDALLALAEFIGLRSCKVI